MPVTTPTAQDVAPVALHSSMPFRQGVEVPGNAVVGRVATQHRVELAHLVSDRSVPPASHQVAEVGEATLES
jgi:hypothetical protein